MLIMGTKEHLCWVCTGTRVGRSGLLVPPQLPHPCAARSLCSPGPAGSGESSEREWVDVACLSRV